MLEQEVMLKASDGHEIFVRHWLPEEKTAIRGVVHINHGMAEHCTRYRPIAERMTRDGIVVFAHDHRGHGRSVANDEILGHYARTASYVRGLSHKCERTSHPSTLEPQVSRK